MARNLAACVFVALLWLVAAPTAHAMYSPTLGSFINRDPGPNPISGAELGETPPPRGYHPVAGPVSQGHFAFRPYGGRGYQDGMHLYSSYFIPNSLDPSGLYSSDKKCCCEIDKWVAKNKLTQARLKDMYSRWSPGQGWADYDLSSFSNSSGWRSQEYNNAPECIREATDNTYDGLLISGLAGIKIIIGGEGYWNPMSWIFSDSGYANGQWWMTKIALEHFRAVHLGGEFNNILEECRQKYPGCCGDSWRAWNCIDQAPKCLRKQSGGGNTSSPPTASSSFNV